MADNILSASVEVTLDGRAFTLCYRAYAFISYAEQTGGDLLADLREIGATLARFRPSTDPAAAALAPPGLGAVFGKLRDVLWAGLADAQPGITRDEVARLFSLRDLGELTPAITKALQLSLPDQARPARPTKAAKHRVSPLIDGHASGLSSGTVRDLGPLSS